MKSLMKQLLVLAAVLGGLWAATAWPRINSVETGKTPEYPDLQVHDYGTSVDSVVKGVKTVAARLPGWEVVGVAKGPAGAEIQAVHTLALLRLKDDVTIRVRREGSRTKVSARSKSRIGPWDFGQNARNLREILDALDHEVF
ncbi:MAG: DUF1499 domain-containing protein [Vicinamibacteria bacterium]